MENRKKLSEKINSFLYNHLWLKQVLEYGFAFIMTAMSSFLFAFAFCAFLNPRVDELETIVSGGVSGLSLCFKLPLELSGKFAPQVLDSIFSVLYIVINIPLLIISYKKGIGKRFILFTIINVGLTSLFTFLLKETSLVKFVNEVASAVNEKGAYLARALFAGVLVGFSSAFAFFIDSSAGGFDILSYSISMKKGTNTGPIVAAIDVFVLLTYNIVYACSGQMTWANAFTNLLFSAIYLVTITLIIDLINIRNKKAKVEIITDNEDLPGKLLTHIPHGATVTTGTGVYSGKTRLVVNMIVSTNEVKKVIKFVKELDPESFVNVSPLQQVYGRFHMKPIK